MGWDAQKLPALFLLIQRINVAFKNLFRRWIYNWLCRWK